MKVCTDSCLFGAWAANEINVCNNVEKILDIGTGTGLLSLMLAQKTKAYIEAIEVDKKSFEQAKKNCADSLFSERIVLYNADARNFAFHKFYDVIICNPPFYEKELKSNNERKNTAHHDTGLLLNEVLDIIKKKLQPDGVFFLLLPYKRITGLENSFASHALSMKQKILVRQSIKHDYFRIMIQGTHSTINTDTTYAEISIRDHKIKYTLKFIKLLQDFYIQL